MATRVVRTDRSFDNEHLQRVARSLLDAAPLCALSTVAAGGHAYINTMYFARTYPWNLVWISAPDSRHSRNIRERSTAAIAVYDSSQRWGGRDRGIQVFGRASELHGRPAQQAMNAYAERFARDERILGRYLAYQLRPTNLKLFEEAEFGAGTFVSARVRRDGTLEWQHTEEYGDPT
jgi:uncharacterized protein YhbP (UPF0306 family)